MLRSCACNLEVSGNQAQSAGSAPLEVRSLGSGRRVLLGQPRFQASHRATPPGRRRGSIASRDWRSRRLPRSLAACYKAEGCPARRTARVGYWSQRGAGPGRAGGNRPAVAPGRPLVGAGQGGASGPGQRVRAAAGSLAGLGYGQKRKSREAQGPVIERPGRSRPHSPGDARTCGEATLEALYSPAGGHPLPVARCLGCAWSSHHRMAR